MRVVYSIVFYLATPFILLHLAVRGRRDRRYRQRWKERFGFYGHPAEKGGIVLHAASVGEFNAALPLIRALLAGKDKAPLTITSFTPTGSARAQTLRNEGVGHCYAPLDLPGAVKRFFDHVKPRLLVVMETEIWPNLYAEASRRGIPILLANGRISDHSLRSYSRFPGLVGDALRRVSHVAAQSERDAERFVALGAEPGRIVSAGNLKFDMDPPGGAEEGAAALRRQWWEDRPVVIAGSTHEADDHAVLNAFGELLKVLPDTLLILVPRHPERFAPAAELAAGMGFRTELHSAGEACSPDAQVFVIDAMGELFRYYACSDVAIIGGSFGDTGGHNALEAAALGRAVVLGPNMQNFPEITKAMLVAGAAVQVREEGRLGETLAGLLRDPGARARMGNAGRQLVEQGRGALSGIMETIESLLA